MKYYTYAYLNEEGVPYYIGKGQGQRAWGNHGNVEVPPDDRVLILKRFNWNIEALRHEKYIIDVLGVEENGGPLKNRLPKPTKKSIYLYGYINTKTNEVVKNLSLQEFCKKYNFVYGTISLKLREAPEDKIKYKDWLIGRIKR